MCAIPLLLPFVQGKTVVAVTSGANINFERLRLVSELAELGSRSEVMMVTTIPERAGAFSDFVDAATAGSSSKFDVTEFKYRWAWLPLLREVMRALQPSLLCGDCISAQEML